MKTVLINKFAGTVEIPDSYNLVREGVTQSRDQVCDDYRFKLWTDVKAGGIPITRYSAVRRPVKGARYSTSNVRKVDKPKKQRKRKTAKKIKKIVKKKKK